MSSLLDGLKRQFAKVVEDGPTVAVIHYQPCTVFKSSSSMCTFRRAMVRAKFFSYFWVSQRQLVGHRKSHSESTMLDYMGVWPGPIGLSLCSVTEVSKVTRRSLPFSDSEDNFSFCCICFSLNKKWTCWQASCKFLCNLGKGNIIQEWNCWKSEVSGIYFFTTFASVLFIQINVSSFVGKQLLNLPLERRLSMREKPCVLLNVCWKKISMKNSLLIVYVYFLNFLFYFEI